MKTILQIVATSVSILFVTGCVSITPLHNIDNNTIVQELSEQQVKDAIISGAETAGWTAEVEEPGKVLAVLNVRRHMVAVNIRYTEKSYNINYAHSNHMKVHCTDKDKITKAVVITNWPEEVCGGARPALIHKAYNEWVENLNTEINAALSSN